MAHRAGSAEERFARQNLLLLGDFAHLTFNATAALVIYVPPMMRRVPLALATGLGKLGSRNRMLAGAYIVVVFFGIPLLLLFISGAFSRE